MTATGHALIGAIIAAKVGNPALAIPLAIISHLAADVVPHWDVATNKKEKTSKRLLIEAFIDVAAGFILSLLLLAFFFPATDPVYAFIVIIAAQSFDWATAPYYFFRMHYAPFTWVYQFSKYFNNDLDKPWGIVTQIAAVGVLLLFALFL